MKASKKAIIGGMFWSLSERMAAQLVSVIVGIVLARLLTPTEYGTVSLVTIFVAIANVFVTNGFGTALIQKDNADNVDFSTVFYFGIVFSLGLYGILYAAAVPIAKFYQMPILVPILRVLSIKVPISAINSVQQAYVSRHMIFKKFFWATLFGTLVSAVVGIVMAYSGFGAWALVGQELTNTVIDTIVLWFTVKWRPIWTFSIERLKTLFSYGWKLLVQGLIISIYGNIRSLLIGKFYSTQDLAYYSKGNGYPNMIATNVNTAMSNALFPALSKEQQNYGGIVSITKRATKLISYIMSPLLIGFAAVGETFITVLLTDKWQPMLPYLVIICICLLVRPAQTATLQAIKATGKSDVVLKMDIPVRVFGLFALVVSLKFGVIYFAISEVIVEYFCFFVYGITCSQIVGYRMFDILIDIGENIIQAAMMGVVVYLAGKVVKAAPVITLLIQVALGAGLYLLISIALKNSNYLYLWNGLKKSIEKPNK